MTKDLKVAYGRVLSGSSFHYGSSPFGHAQAVDTPIMFTNNLFPILVLAVSVAAYANPGPCSGSCNVHDPAMTRRSDGTYFRFSTGNCIQIATARSLAGPWTIEGSALPDGSTIDLVGNQDLWGPDISLIGDTYFLYYSVSVFGSQLSAIGVATSTTMDVGTWTDHGSTGVTSNSSVTYNAIDGNLMQLPGGGNQLNFGSFYGDIQAIAMSSPLEIDGSVTPIAFDPSPSHAEEGAFMFYRWGYYYLLYSAGTCCSYDISRPAPGQEYKIKVCRSRSSTGGFVSRSVGWELNNWLTGVGRQEWCFLHRRWRDGNT